MDKNTPILTEAEYVDALSVQRCATCIRLRQAVESLIATNARDDLLLPALEDWQRHKDDAHPVLSAYLRRPEE